MLVGLDPNAPPMMVFVGSVAGEFAALASRVAQLQSAYNIHIHPAGSPNTGVPTVTSAVNFASSKVQVAP